MSYEIAVSDTCFLIDWAKYSKRDILFKLFLAVYIPEEVLNEVISENVLKWIVSMLRQRKFILYTARGPELDEARRIMDYMARIPWIRSIETPEAICLALGYLYGYTVITENIGAHQAVDVIPGYKRVRVMKSLTILKEAIIKGYISTSIEEIERVFEEYEVETKHLFPIDELTRVITEVKKCLLMR